MSLHYPAVQSKTDLRFNLRQVYAWTFLSVFLVCLFVYESRVSGWVLLVHFTASNKMNGGVLNERRFHERNKDMEHRRMRQQYRHLRC